MKKILYMVTVSIVIFFSFHPILENKTLYLSKTLIITKEPNNYYFLEDKNLKFDKTENQIYVKSLIKYKDIWIGYVGDCWDEKTIFPGHYLRGKEKGEFPFIKMEINKNMCEWLKKERQGYFYVRTNGTIKYHLTKNELKKELKIKDVILKDPNYYIQKYGKNQDTNEFYFSKDTTKAMFQIPSEVRKKIYTIRNVLFILFIFPSMILLINDIFNKIKKINYIQNLRHK